MIDVRYVMTERAVENFVQFKSDLEKIRAMATPEQIKIVSDSVTKMNLATGQHFSIDENTGTAIIPIVGTLTPKPEICVSLSDGSQTLYSSIAEATAKSDAMNSVKQIRYEFDTPGGFAQGVELAALAIKQAKKPTIGVVKGQACSGGFWLLSQCDKKIAATPSAEVGSIGVIIEAIDRSKMDADIGIKRVVLTSKNAPEKFKDIKTKEGQGKIIDHLTKLETVFIDRVAEGFGVSAETVKSDFGKGGVLFAAEALKVGMLDKIDEKLMNSIDPVEGDSLAGEINIKNKTEVSMNLKELLNQNPEAKAEFEASKIAIAKGEKSRISEVLTLSGVILSDEAKAAINSDQTAGDYAKAQLTAQNAVLKVSNNKKEIGEIKADNQIPADVKVEEKKDGEPKKDVIDTPEKVEAMIKETK